MKTLTLPKKIAAFSLLAAVAMPAFSDDYVIDKSHAFVGFEYNHLGFSTTIARFDGYDAKIDANWGNPAASSVDVTIDISSLDTDWQKRDEHLLSKDFFNAEAFPKAHFKSTAIKVTGENTAKITGDLTMMGITKPVTLQTTMVKRGPHPFKPEMDNVGISAHGTLKRSDWGIDKYVPAVSDDVVLRFEFELNEVQ